MNESCSLDGEEDPLFYGMTEKQIDEYWRAIAEQTERTDNSRFWLIGITVNHNQKFKMQTKAIIVSTKITVKNKFNC